MTAVAAVGAVGAVVAVVAVDSAERAVALADSLALGAGLAVLVSRTAALAAEVAPAESEPRRARW